MLCMPLPYPCAVHTVLCCAAVKQCTHMARHCSTCHSIAADNQLAQRCPSIPGRVWVLLCVEAMLYCALLRLSEQIEGCAADRLTAHKPLGPRTNITKNIPTPSYSPSSLLLRISACIRRHICSRFLGLLREREFSRRWMIITTHNATVTTTTNTIRCRVGASIHWWPISLAHV